MRTRSRSNGGKVQDNKGKKLLKRIKKWINEGKDKYLFEKIRNDEST